MQPARGPAFWLVFVWVALTVFVFYIAAVRSLFDPDYQWAAGYFFRTTSGSFIGREGFLPAFIPLLAGFAILLYGLRGERRVFALGALLWAGFWTLNLGLMGDLPGLSADTLEFDVVGAVVGWGIYTAFALAALWAAFLLRRGLGGLSFGLQPPTAFARFLLVAAALLFVPIGWLDTRLPVHGSSDKIAAILIIAQFVLALTALSLKRPSPSSLLE